MAPLAPIYTIFEVGARAEKRDFLVEVFQKVFGRVVWESSEINLVAPPLEKFLDPHLPTAQKFAYRTKSFVKIWSLLYNARARKIRLVQKRVDKYFESI